MLVYITTNLHSLIVLLIKKNIYIYVDIYESKPRIYICISKPTKLIILNYKYSHLEKRLNGVIRREVLKRPPDGKVLARLVQKPVYLKN